MKATSLLLRHQNSIAISFSGGGHLLSYHLGVAETFLSHESSSRQRLTIPPVEAVSGASAGAIAAVVYTHLGHRIHEYTERFLTDGGNAMKHLKNMLHEEESMSAPVTYHNIHKERRQAPGLYIATTKCIDGSLKRWSFKKDSLYASISSQWNTDSILLAVKASCTIPPSFHPVDCISNISNLSYPPEDGILMEDGFHYVDGGIASTAPTYKDDMSSSPMFSIIVSPLSYSAKNPEKSTLNRISPKDESWRLLPLKNITCRSDFLVKPSMQNLKALRVASGAASTHELQTWYELGKDDAQEKLKEWFR